MIFSFYAYPQTELHTPYPIIFVHGLVGDNSTWSEPGNYNDIIDYLEGAGLTNGGVIHITLDNFIDNLSISNTEETDVHLFTTDPPPGDFYIINFNVHSSGEIPAGAIGHVLLNSPIFSTDTIIPVTSTVPFVVNDIISIQNERMQITGINEFSIEVERGILETEAVFHFLPDVIYNLSNESNQASIYKQGYGLKMAIDAILDVTDADKVILIGHSMGGLAARQYIRMYSSLNNVAKIVTIGTPHGGANDSWVPGWLLSFEGIDDNSDAVRDLNFNPGVYLFGGSEYEIPDNFYSRDVDADSIVEDYISGLNYYFPEEISRTWIVSSFMGLPNDGIVTTNSQYLTVPEDTIMTNRHHLSILGNPGEAKDYYTLLRGMDEPSDTCFAYEIEDTSITKGFITYQRFNNSLDVDLFKINMSERCKLSISLLANGLTGIYEFELLDNDLFILKNSMNIYDTIFDTVNAGTYYIRLKGNATNLSYQYPYTLTTSSLVIPPNALSATPENLLEFYDVVVNEYRDESVTLTNNSQDTISVTNLEITGSNSDQYLITTPVSFNVPPSSDTEVTVRLSPTISGVKTATLVITNTSLDETLICLPLHGIGVDSATMTLIINPDSVYNFGNVIISHNRTKIFKFKNTGSDTLTVTGLSISGMNADDYTIIEQPDIPFNLVTGETQQVTIQFSPTSIGVKVANFVFINNSDNFSPADSITLYGNGKNSVYTGIYNSITKYESWFDDNYSTKTIGSVPYYPFYSYSLNTSMETPNLSVGLHRFNIRFQDEEGNWSSVISQLFYKQPIPPAEGIFITAYEYWFDESYDLKVIGATDSLDYNHLITQIPTDELEIGLHSFNMRYKDNTEQWSSVISQLFYKQPLQLEGGSTLIAFEYWFDDNYVSRTVEETDSVETHHLITGLPTNNINQGLHGFHVRYKDSKGVWSSVISQFFYKAPVTNGVPNLVKAYRYWFDMDDNSMVAVDLPEPVNPLNLVAQLNTCPMDDGEHRVNFQFQDVFNYWSSVLTDTFNIAPVNPVINPDGPASFCVGGSLVLSAGLANAYLWSTGETTPEITVLSPGSYHVTIENTCGDTLTSDIFIVTVDDPTIAGIVTGGTFISLGYPTDTLRLEGTNGSVLNWQKKINDNDYLDIPESSGNIHYIEIPSTSGTWYYRTVVRNGECNIEFSMPTMVYVFNDPISRSWTGAIDDEWNKAGNWSPAGVPSPIDDVEIPGTAPNMPVVRVPGLSCHQLTVHSNAVVTIVPGMTLTVNGVEALDK